MQFLLEFLVDNEEKSLEEAFLAISDNDLGKVTTKMKEIKYTPRVYVDRRNAQVMIRVRWNKKEEAAFALKCKAEVDKWDTTLQRARFNTIHKIGEQNYSARIVNGIIEAALDRIATIFTEFSLMEVVPTRSMLKQEFEYKENDEKKKEETPQLKCTFEEMYEEFCNKCSDERNWSANVHYKYQQIWNQLHGCDPNITLESLTKEKMVQLKNWYVENGYRNITIKKQFKILKSMLRWLQGAGYTIQPGVLSYKVNLTVVPKTVTFLKYKELMAFYEYEFPEEKEYLTRARDLFCFMAFTSLRYSDLYALKKVNVIGNNLMLCTQKTSDSLTIPLIDRARAIVAKYWKDDDPMTSQLFPVISNQKLNDYIQEAAKIAGLDREIFNVYYTGSTRHEEYHPFYDIITCHCARRTFVCCSLAMGIPPTIVMSCTGHKDYESMKPYIEVADETQQKEMSKWNAGSNKDAMLKTLESIPEDKLKAVLQLLGVA